MTKTTTIKSGDDITRLIEQYNHRIRNGEDARLIHVRNGKGSHRIAVLPNGVPLTYHVHGEFRPGIRCKFTKLLAAAGLLAALVIAGANLAQGMIP
jgi:hypothetical protein